MVFCTNSFGINQLTDASPAKQTGEADTSCSEAQLTATSKKPG